MAYNLLVFVPRERGSIGVFSKDGMDALEAAPWVTRMMATLKNILNHSQGR